MEGKSPAQTKTSIAMFTFLSVCLHVRMLMCAFRCRQNWRRGFGSGRLRATWATVSDGVRCSLKAARSLRYPSWTNPAPKISRPRKHTPSQPATSPRSEGHPTALLLTCLVFGRHPEQVTKPQSLIVECLYELSAESHTGCQIYRC